MSTHKATAARCLSHHQATYGQPPMATLRRLALSMLFTIMTNSYQTTCTVFERTFNKRQQANARQGVDLTTTLHALQHASQHAINPFVSQAISLCIAVHFLGLTCVEMSLNLRSLSEFVDSKMRGFLCFFPIVNFVTFLLHLFVVLVSIVCNFYILTKKGNFFLTFAGF